MDVNPVVVAIGEGVAVGVGVGVAGAVVTMSAVGEVVGIGGLVGVVQPDKSMAAMVARRAANLIPMPIERVVLCLGSAMEDCGSPDAGADEPDPAPLAPATTARPALRGW